MAAKSSRLHAVVTGHVQGVGFRYFVRQQADSLSLVGWVRNLHNGDVELIAEGEQKDVQSLLTAVRQGPRGASVINVQVDWQVGSGEFNNFAIKATG